MNLALDVERVLGELRCIFRFCWGCWFFLRCCRSALGRQSAVAGPLGVFCRRLAAQLAFLAAPVVGVSQESEDVLDDGVAHRLRIDCCLGWQSVLQNHMMMIT